MELKNSRNRNPLSECKMKIAHKYWALALTLWCSTSPAQPSAGSNPNKYDWFYIESIEVVALPVKESGACWDPCDRQTQIGDGELAVRMEQAGRGFQEVGTQEAEARMNARIPSPEELQQYYELSKTLFSAITSQTRLPEIAVNIRLFNGSQLQYNRFQRDRFEVTFSDGAYIPLTKDPQTRYLLIDVVDLDILEHDQMGFRRINIADSVYEKGGLVAVQFNRIHFLRITLRKQRPPNQ